MHRNRARWMRDVMSGRRIWTIEDSGMRYERRRNGRGGVCDISRTSTNNVRCHRHKPCLLDTRNARMSSLNRCPWNEKRRVTRGMARRPAHHCESHVMQVRKYIANMLFEFFVFSVRKELL